MDIWVLDRDFVNQGVVDAYKSLIWTDRYNDVGDFELIIPASLEVAQLIKEDRYLWIVESDRVMIIETIAISTDFEEGDLLKATGRSLVSYLDRRIIWGYKRINGNLQNGIKTLLNENAISPSNANRRIPGLIFEDSTDSKITSETMDVEFFGESLLEAIQTLCVSKDIGFKIIPNFDTKQLVFSLYKGVDHSPDQNENSFVMFSPDYENIGSTNSVETKVGLKTVAMVGSQNAILGEAYLTQDIGFDRRELFVNGTSKDSTPIQTGKDELAKTKITKAFEGDVDYKLQFIYGVDYFIGDLVFLRNKYGFESKARITEMVVSDDEDGIRISPTFIIYSEEENN